jgi:hypothetical protein
MTRSQIFIAAHAIAKKNTRIDISYRIKLSIALKRSYPKKTTMNNKPAYHSPATIYKIDSNRYHFGGYSESQVFSKLKKFNDFGRSIIAAVQKAGFESVEKAETRKDDGLYQKEAMFAIPADRKIEYKQLLNSFKNPNPEIHSGSF